MGAIAAQPVNWRPIFIVTGAVVLVITSWAMLHFIRSTPQPQIPGIVGDFPQAHTLKVPVIATPVPTYGQEAKNYLLTGHTQAPVVATQPTPKASPTPCRACQEQVEDYLNRVKAPFADRRDLYVAPSVMAGNTLRAGAPAGYDGFHR